MSDIIDLCGTWELFWNDGERGVTVAEIATPGGEAIHPLEAEVPGEVHLDLMMAGLIEEPAVGLNCLKARWVEETVWRYRRTFDCRALETGERAHLVFEQLDLVATVYLNGEKVGSHANVFCPCRIDVTDRLREGENVLVVELDSGLFEACERPFEGFGMHDYAKLNKRNWLRKTQSSFNWDWSQRLVNVGISGPVRLEICSEVRVDRFVALAELSDDLTDGRVTGRLFVEGLDQETRKGVLSVGIEGTERTVDVRVEIGPGPNCIEASISLKSPELWWPIGHGDQNLYTVRATLAAEGGVVAVERKKVGFRHVRVNQEPHPEGGNYFIIEINGKPIFCKGGNFVPADLIFARLDRARYDTLVDRALEANFNLLRIWGGGLYESDDFYEVCNEMGILVWQEFIFACAKYPATDEKFLESVKQEATHQVRRIAHHPSLIIWCGNNEMEWGCHDWGYEKGVAYPDYAIFHLVLPRILKQEDGTRYYQPSSPYSPDHNPPNCDDQGDQHPWAVGFRNTDFRDYRQMICRFPNEGGILGPTALPTVKACLAPGQERVKSFSWEVHENSISCRGWADGMLEQWLGKSIESMSLEEYVYYGGIVQGEGLSEYIRNFRRRMFSSSSAIFWMYNDCWPMVRSWTIVDYYLRRTPCFHPVRRAFAPVAVVVAHEDGKLRVFGVNEGPAVNGALRCGLFALAGDYPVDQTKSVSLPANASKLLAEFEESELLRLGEHSHGAFAVLSSGGRQIACDRLFLPFFKEMTWPQPNVVVRCGEGKAVLESEVFAWRVCVDLNGDDRYPDNFFDLLPGVPYEIDWPEELGEPKVLNVGNLR